jgi:glyoxylase-like metal-dependent hydrolase (beta-lactamase superfamily II)
MHRITKFILMLAACWAAAAQTSPPPAEIEPGVLPQTWITGGPNCLEIPAWQIHEYNPTFYILRESGCTNYEKPFLYLIFGGERALLVDTGAGESDAAAVVGKLIAQWQKREKRGPVALVVSHSHGHGDHTAGDQGFAGMANVTLVRAAPEELQKAFGIAGWPDQMGKIDLGNRVIDVVPVPGHQAAAVAYYDRKTGILLTGDNLYPGRLYISDFQQYLASTRRLVEFTRDKVVTHILGTHIEQSSTPYVDYVIGTAYQPHEHALELGRAHLLELLGGLEAMQAKPVKLALRDFTIFPREPRPAPLKK